MRNKFDRELDTLNLELIKMGSLIENAIEYSSKALINRDLSLVKKVNELEIEIDDMERNIESHCS
jgi:phosphate transport system protein